MYGISQENSRYTEKHSESKDSRGGHWKSKSQKQKPSIEDDDLSKPWVCAETDPFTSRIRHFNFPKTRMPSHIKTYDGSGDPEDHLKIFQAAAKTERWAMPTWCHMFNSTLTGNARVWFDDLPPEYIDSYDDLREAFLKNYLQQKKCIRDPIVLHNIKQRDGEYTEDFIQRYNRQSGNVQRAGGCFKSRKEENPPDMETPGRKSQAKFQKRRKLPQPTLPTIQQKKKGQAAKEEIIAINEGGHKLVTAESCGSSLPNDLASPPDIVKKHDDMENVLVEELKEKSVNEIEVLAVVEEEGDSWMTPIHEYLNNETLPAERKKARSIKRKSQRFAIINGTLYKKSFLGPWLRCVGPSQANYVLQEIHEGSCSMHAGTQSVVAKALKTGYYWPTMHKDARALIKACQECQVHKPVPRNPQEILNPITSPWPFYK
ncbi:reverse transcriptase domain-containing protein [Tanacetum coccineum]